MPRLTPFATRGCADHLNAEIASGGGYMGDVGVCIRWLKSTFLWARLAKNPTHYEMPKGVSDDELERRLKALCIAQLRQLADAQMVLVDDDGLSIAPVTHAPAPTAHRTHARTLKSPLCFASDLSSSMTRICTMRPRVHTQLPLGTLMARACIDYETATSLGRLTARCGLREVVQLCADATELQDAATLRRTEVKQLYEVNQAGVVRFPLLEEPAAGSKAAPKRLRIKTSAQKAALLLQLRASGSGLGEFSSCEMPLVLGARRVLRALLEHLTSLGLAKPLRASLLLLRSVECGVGWHDEREAEVPPARSPRA
tara:strand:+ start:451 stop:1389 length:939 start_codon:yes stop_codon:yes gene_type:complete